MNASIFKALLLISLSFLLIAAKPAKKPEPSGELFFTMKGQPYPLERTFPGITAALMLSDDQKADLFDAQQGTIDSPELREKKAAVKGKDAANEAERDAVRKELEEARAELAKEVARILTPQQKALIEKIQAAAMEAMQEARQTFEEDFTGSKGNEAKQSELREKVRIEAEDLFVQKLEKILTPAQMQAVQNAAAQQREAEERGRKNKIK